MAKYTYIQREITDFFLYRDTKLEADLFDIGTTWEDYVDFKFVQLSKAQAKFHEDNPEASPYEVWNMELNPPYVRTLEDAKNEMIQRIDEYDQSENVNGFTVNGTQNGWITAEERSNYRSSIDAAKLLGVETLTFYIGDMMMELSPEQAEFMLAQIQLYADQCFIVTKQHKLAVEALDTIEAVDAFPYTEGYPQQIDFIYPAEEEVEEAEQTEE